MEMHPLYIKLAEAIAEAPSIPPCQTTDPELWFADQGEWSSTRLAKQLCSTCPVKELCLQYALETDEYAGVWGGLSSRERQRMRSAHQRLRFKKSA